MHVTTPYETSGFCVVPSILDDGTLTETRQRIEHLHALALSGRDPELSSQCVFEQDLPAAKRNGLTVDSAQNAVFILPDPSRHDRFFLSLLTAAPLVELVSRLLGTDDIVVHFANITSKAPQIGSGIAWHRDFPNRFISPTTPAMLRTMICIDGMEQTCGATRFVAGSQHDPQLKGSDIDATDDRIVTATCAPGAVVAIHPLVLHGGAPNVSERPRRNIVVQWGTRTNPLVTDMRESITGKTVAELKAMMV